MQKALAGAICNPCRIYDYKVGTSYKLAPAGVVRLGQKQNIKILCEESSCSTLPTILIYKL